jgi:hypothetical protein
MKNFFVAHFSKSNYWTERRLSRDVQWAELVFEKASYCVNKAVQGGLPRQNDVITAFKRHKTRARNASCHQPPFFERDHSVTMVLWCQFPRCTKSQEAGFTFVLKAARRCS